MSVSLVSEKSWTVQRSLFTAREITAAPSFPPLCEILKPPETTCSFAPHLAVAAKYPARLFVLVLAEWVVNVSDFGVSAIAERVMSATAASNVPVQATVARTREGAHRRSRLPVADEILIPVSATRRVYKRLKPAPSRRNLARETVFGQHPHLMPALDQLPRQTELGSHAAATIPHHKQKPTGSQRHRSEQAHILAAVTN